MSFLNETLADRRLRSELIRPALKDLAINSTTTGQGIYRDRKPAVQSTHLPGMRNRHHTLTRQKGGERQLQPEQYRRALLISEALRHIPRFANRVSGLHDPQSSDASCDRRAQLKTGSCRTWQLLGDPTLPSLSKVSICQLREALLRDITVLYANGFSYTPDLTRLKIVSKTTKTSKTSKGRIPKTYRPLIDVFDFSLDAIGQTIPSPEGRKRLVEAQFDVLETLAVLSRPHRAIPVDLEPTCVAQVLRKHRPVVPEQNLVIRLVKNYSTELGQLVIELTRDHLRRLPWRTSPPAAPTRKATLDRCSTVGHMLALINQPIKDEKECTKHQRLLKDRATLSVLHASLLIHQHANVVSVNASRGLLERSSKDKAGSYVSQDDFNAVIHARQVAEEALDDLLEQGIELDSEISRFIREDH